MFGKINWKIVIAIGMAALVISILLGGIQGVRFSILLVRGLLFGTLFSVLCFGIQIVLDRVFPELSEDQVENTEERKDPPSLDMTLPQETATVQDTAEGSESAPPESSESSEDTASVEDLPEAAESVDDHESQAPDEALVARDTSDQPPAPAAQGAVEESSKSGQTENTEREVPKSKKKDQLDSLPDLSSYSDAFLESEGDENTVPESDFGQNDSSPVGPGYGTDEAIDKKIPGGDDPEIMAKSIRTVLKRDKS